MVILSLYNRTCTHSQFGIALILNSDLYSFDLQIPKRYRFCGLLFGIALIFYKLKYGLSRNSAAITSEFGIAVMRNELFFRKCPHALFGFSLILISEIHSFKNNSKPFCKRLYERFVKHYLKQE